MIFHMSIPCVKTFQCVSTFFTLWPWSWRLTLFYNFNVGNNFWTVGSRALVFHMCILWDKTFQWVPTILTLWPWSFTYFFFKNVKLANYFWTVRSRTFMFHLGTNNCDLDLGIYLLVENFNFVINIWIVSAKALIFHMSIFSIRTFLWVPTFLTLWPWPWSLAYVLNTLTLLIKFE